MDNTFYKECFEKACEVCEALDSIARDKNNSTAEEYKNKIIHCVESKNKYRKEMKSG